jgi:mono/diheme cytochrome c family protein
MRRPYTYDRAGIAGLGIGALAILTFATVVALPGTSRAADPKPIPPEAVKQAKDIFTGRCTPCHGPAGKGDGPASAGLTPKPRNLGDPAWQKSVTDEHVEKIIKFGGAAVGKSPMMPGKPDLMAKPEVVRALTVQVRALAPPSK